MTGAQPSTRSRVVLATLATLVVFSVGWAVGRTGGEPAKTPPVPNEPAAPNADSTLGPPRTRLGAVDAARRYARLYASPPILDSGSRADLFARTALPRTARRFEASYRHDLPTLRRSLGLPTGGNGPSPTLVMRTVSIGYEVRAFNSDRASVRLWTVLILGNGAAVAPQAAWRAVDVDLTWRAVGWKVADLRDRPGPTPALLGVPSPAGVFADDQAGYMPHEP